MYIHKSLPQVLFLSAPDLALFDDVMQYYLATKHSLQEDGSKLQLSSVKPMPTHAELQARFCHTSYQLYCGVHDIRNLHDPFDADAIITLPCMAFGVATGPCICNAVGYGQ